MSKMKDRLHTGELYLPGDEEIMEAQTKRLDRVLRIDQRISPPGHLQKFVLAAYCRLL